MKRARSSTRPVHFLALVERALATTLATTMDVKAVTCDACKIELRKMGCAC